MANEIITGSGIAAAIGVKLLNDVCGPTAKYVGGEFASGAKAGVENIKRIFEEASKLTEARDKTQGQIPPRVLKEILLEGYFCEDELQASYLGGVLASAKGPVPRDDRAISYCSLVNSLSTYQLRTHCILYSALLRTTHLEISGRPYLLKEPVLNWVQRHGVTVVIRESDYLAAMDFSDGENPPVIAEHSFVGLENKGLSEGGAQVSVPRGRDAGEPPFRFFHPTILGVELFLWGHGLR